MHSGRPILSVILPVYNCENYVVQAINCILNQTFDDFELLIADDGSSDASKRIIDNYAGQDSRIRVSHNSKNCGKVSTVNRLLGLCKGDYITVHDSDDFSHPNRFFRQVEILQADPALVMCGTSFRAVNEKDVLFSEVIMPGNLKQILSRIKDASQFHGPTMVIRRAAVTDYLYRPFFDEYNEDCDLVFRLIEKGSCTNLSEILYTYRIRPNSLSKTVTARRKNLYKMAVMFHEQRVVHGSDDLMKGESQSAEAKLARLLEPYRMDPSRIHRENAAFLMYYRLNRAAIVNAMKACMVKPFYFNNWRTLQYCIRKSYLGI